MKVQDVARSLISHIGAPVGAVTVAVESVSAGAWRLRVLLRDDVAGWKVPEVFEGYSVEVEPMPDFTSDTLH